MIMENLYLRSQATINDSAAKMEISTSPGIISRPAFDMDIEVQPQTCKAASTLVAAIPHNLLHLDTIELFEYQSVYLAAWISSCWFSVEPVHFDTLTIFLRGSADDVRRRDALASDTLLGLVADAP